MKQLLASTLFLFFTIFYSCKKEQITQTETNLNELDSVEIPENYKLILNDYAAGARARIEVYVENEIKTGPTKFYSVAYDSITNKVLNNGKLTLNFFLEDDSVYVGWMFNQARSSELEITPKGIYESIAYFHFPTTKKSKWSIVADYTNNKGNIRGITEKIINVESSIPANVFPYIKHKEGNYVNYFSLYLLQQPNWHEGINDFEIKAVEVPVNGWEFEISKDLTFELEAFMPDSSIVSPGNINPVHIGKGIYKGKINLTKKGLWLMKLKFYEVGVLVNDKVFFELIL